MDSEQDESIYRLAYECEKLFNQRIAEQELQESSQYNIGTSPLLTELRHRFITWAAHLGVFAKKSLCLDRRLINLPDLQDLVVRLLDTLRRMLAQLVVESGNVTNRTSTNVKEEESGKELPSPNVAVLEIIEEALGRLNRLGNAIRQASAGGLTSRAKRFAEGLDLTPFETLLHSSVRGLYPGANQSLQIHLSQSMTNSYKKILFMRSRHKSLQARRSKPHPQLFPIREEQGISTKFSTCIVADTPQSQTTLLDSPQQPKLLPRQFMQSLQSELSSMDTRVLRAQLRDSQAAGSRRYKTSSIQINQVDYPPAPQAIGQANMLTCDWCFETHPKEHMEGSNWKRHLDNDFEPYLCIAEQCLESCPRYQKFEDWFEHMQTRHGPRWHQEIYKSPSWICPLCEGDCEEYTNPQALLSHMEGSHSQYFTPEQVQMMIRQSQTHVRRPLEECPLCSCDIPAENGKNRPRGLAVRRQSIPAKRHKEPLQRQTSKSARNTAESGHPVPYQPLNSTSDDSDIEIEQTGSLDMPQKLDFAEVVARHVASHLQTLMCVTIRMITLQLNADETLSDVKSDSVDVDGGSDSSWRNNHEKMTDIEETTKVNFSEFTEIDIVPEEEHFFAAASLFTNSDHGWDEVELGGAISIEEDIFLQKLLASGAYQSHLDDNDLDMDILSHMDYSATLGQLPVAQGASFNSYAEEHNPRCLPHTRIKLLNDIYRWIDEPSSKPIFWLNGMAGTGKSTISRTVAQARHDRGDLGATFFFKRSTTDQGNLSKFVSTLAHQLASRIPRITLAIKNAVDMDPAIIDKTVREQFQKLIQEPLSKATAASCTRPSVVIVVDALDECESDADIKLLLELFSTLRFAGPLRVRVFVTSRPELPVRLGFSSIGNTYQGLILHKIPQSIIEHDISVFLRHELANIRSRFNEETVEELKLPIHWPGEANLEKLTRAAVPLFIFAATICRFVNDSYLGSPDKLLRSVLHHTGNNQASKLDMTYSPVLEQQVVNRSGRERCDIIESFRLIAGTIITLASPLSARALALLLDVHIDEVTTRLRMLHSVLEVPESLDSPVRLLHLSFRDYLVDPENIETVEFWVDEKLAHRKLAKHCLRIMRGTLRKNICGLSFPGMRRSAVDGRQLEECIPPELQYACIYWVYHQTQVDFEPNDSRAAYDFLTTHFHHWVEALSLLCRIKECLESLKSMARWAEDQQHSALSSFVTDAVRFLQASFSVTAETPLQIYSCLSFTPSKSVVRKIFEHAIPRWISTLPKVEENWDACLLTLEGHSMEVRSVVFSHDSKKVASGSGDKTIRIWDAETGECERMLEGHSGWVRSVVFSHDSQKVASGSDDKTIRIWDAETGKCERVLEGHSSSVWSVVFSHDSKKVASGSGDKTIRIWDAETGECERVLEGHSGWVRSVVFSHDSQKVASGSDDKTIRIWDAETGECERVLEGHSSSVWSVVFSHDSKKVASGSGDKTIRIWDAETGECERMLEGHSSSVNSVVFSHGSQKVASGSGDKTIRIWDAETGECERVLEGHSDFIKSVVFSYDSKMVVSASSDKTVRIWSAETWERERALEGHSGSVNSVVFSYDSTKVASASDDKTIRIWNAKTGECERVLEGHSDWARSVVFSHDSIKVASASFDKTVRIWDAETGKCERVLQGHSSSVNSVVFSHDSKKVASASGDKTIRIWNAETGECEQVLEGHSYIVISVVFSHDSKKVASASYDKTMRIWNAETGECDQVLKCHSNVIRSLAFSYNSTKLASTSYDKTVRIWNAKTGECERVLRGHSDGGKSLMFSHDSTKLASASHSKRVRIWNAEISEWEYAISLDNHAHVLSFTPDERGIITNRGVFALTGGLDSRAEPPMSLQPLEASILACQDGTWVTMAGVDLLWLPSECRNGEVAVSGNTLVIGCPSGRVVFLGISMADVEQ
ncbi:WD40-repeat-containing domain protein [Fusarium sp. MPI-SDFR-AT-0072]|nr:WD40-repeat-containing domain protein [Fusarium sp. MPI-SDFR-AT-0072]